MSMVFCRGCGGKIHETALACPHCGAPQKFTSLPDRNNAMRASSAGSDIEKYLLPVGRSGWAIAAGYLAFFALFLIPAPAALFCGVMALRDIKKNPEKLGIPRASFGIVMGGVGSLLLLFLVVSTHFFSK